MMNRDELLARAEVKGYLADLRSSLLRQQPQSAESIIRLIEDHICEAVEDAENTAPPANVGSILRDLGDPFSLVDDLVPDRVQVDLDQSAGQRITTFLATDHGKQTTMLTMAIGSYVLFGVGWFLAIAMVIVSPHWLRSDKAVAASILPVIIGLRLISPYLDLLLFSAPLITWLWLYWRSRCAVRRQTGA